MQSAIGQQNGTKLGILAQWLSLGLALVTQIAYFNGRLMRLEEVMLRHDVAFQDARGERIELGRRLREMESLLWRVQECEKRLEKHEGGK